MDEGVYDLAPDLLKNILEIGKYINLKQYQKDKQESLFKLAVTEECKVNCKKVYENFKPEFEAYMKAVGAELNNELSDKLDALENA